MTRRTAVFVSSLWLIAAAVGAVRAQDWNQWRGPARTGVTAAFSPPSSWPDKPRKVWETTVGAGHSSPVVSGSRAFVLTRVGDDEFVTAFEHQTGKQVWQQRYRAAYQVNPAAESHGKGPKSTPVVEGGRLFTLGITGTLSAFDTASGKPIWRKTFDREFDASSPDFGAAMSPLVDGGSVIVHVGGNKTGALTALEVATGTVKWQWKGDGPAYASPVIAAFGNTRHVITHSRSRLVGISAVNGTLLWSVPFTTSFDQNIVTPIVAGDLVIYSGLEQPLSAIRIRESAGKWTAEPAWRIESLPMYMSTGVLSGGYLFGLTHRNKGQFFAVNPRSGKVLWTTRGREGENAALIAAAELLMATTTEGELVIAHRDATKFAVIKRYTIAESPVWAHPVPAGRGVLIKDAERLAYWTF
jgi:outer membrane protein assembly factor BamB